MKKIFKFFATVASIAAVAGGAFLVYKKFFASEDEDFDFDDSFDDEVEDPTASREYVSINITNEETEAETDEEETMDSEEAYEASDEEAAEAATEDPAKEADAE